MNMWSKCPGQDPRNLKVTLLKCPTCGEEVEMFSNELRVKCSGCGGWVYGEQVPSCIDWCAKAKECIGEERWEQLKGIEAKA
ncbi:MAG: phosphohydrolase [Chloroflexota bacterium]